MTNEERFDRIDANIERLAESVAHLTQYVLDFREETARHFEMVDNRLDVIAANLSNIDGRFPFVTKAILDFGKVSTQLTNDQARNKNANGELTARMERLEEKVSKLINPAA